MTEARPALPTWAFDLLQDRQSGALLQQRDQRLELPDGASAAAIEDGVARFPVAQPDSSIAFYRSVGGAKFHERSSLPYAMSALDTVVYRRYLSELRPADQSLAIVDVGAGDGRNAWHWLRWGYQRVVLVDPVHAALARFRARVAAENPVWLDRILLIEADSRALPLRPGCADRVLAVESLAYLNEDYALGLRECARLLARGGRLFLSDRDYEAGLLTRLFYGGDGVGGMLEQAAGRSILDGNDAQLVRSRCFTADELAAMVTGSGLRIISQRGVSALSLILGNERKHRRIGPEDEAHLHHVHDLLEKLGRAGAIRRCHTIVAEPGDR